MPEPRTDSLVARFVGSRMIPFIQLYALYVLGHGEDGPGGGFQGGVIFAASFVLLALLEGWRRGREACPASVSDALMPTGALLYAGIGLAALLLGGAFLEYGALAAGNEGAKHLAHHLGLIGIETGVMITVTASMTALFFEMSRPHRFLDVTPETRSPGEGTTRG